MSERSPRRIAMEWVAAYNDHDLEGAAFLYEEDATNLQIPWGNITTGRSTIRETFRNVFQAFPDIHVEVENVVEEGSWVFVEWHFRGTMRGAFAGHAPSSCAFAMRGCEVLEVVDGRIRTQRGYWDKTTMFDQSGLRRQRDSRWLSA